MQVDQDDLVFRIPAEYVTCLLIASQDVNENNTKCYDVSYVDDGLLFVFDTNPQVCVYKLVHASGIVVFVCTEIFICL